MPVAAIVDVDGTLVDTNYHHSIAWFRAFRQFGVTLPIWRIHRHIGIGSDRIIESLVDDGLENEHGDDIRTAQGVLYMSLIDEVRPLDEARDLLADLHERDHPVVLASSAKEQEIERYLDALDARSLIAGFTTSADVENTKPDPDVVKAAMEKAGASKAVMIGDSTYDCAAARNAGIEMLAVLTGGFSEEELREAGAAEVFDSIGALRKGLESSPLR
ncbi:MAG TPA: HAD family hydrolase [Actinomycetota bacterium]|jgi:HAD superfamily hydrolase (TIGR01549 family)